MDTYDVARKIIMLGSGEEPELSNGLPPALFPKIKDRPLRGKASSQASADKDSDTKVEWPLLTLDSIGDAVASVDDAGKINYLNRKAQELTGWSMKDAVGGSVLDVLRILNGNTREAVPDYLGEAIRVDRTIYLPENCVLLRRDGSDFPVEDSAAPIYDQDGRTIGAVIVFRDVSAEQAVKREIIRSAEYDDLTGLPNRMLLNDRVTQAIRMALRHKKRIAVLFMDLNGFKKINESLGYSTGDRLLQCISQRLLSCVRASDTVSRHGGDEFVVLLSELEGRDGAATTAKKLVEAVAKPYLIDDYTLTVTASIGVTVYPEDGTDVETLFRNADTAMYEAKDNPKGYGYHLFDSIGNSGARRASHRI